MMENFQQVKNDKFGNPRFVRSWIGLGFNSYAAAIKAANKLGGRKYTGRDFGGGLVFQAYDCQLAEITEDLSKLATISTIKGLSCAKHG